MGLDNEFRKFMGNQVRYWREDRLISLEDFSALCGLSDTTVFRFERGYNVKSVTLYKCLDVCGLKYLDLVKTFQRHRQLPLDMPERE